MGRDRVTVVLVTERMKAHIDALPRDELAELHALLDDRAAWFGCDTWEIRVTQRYERLDDPPRLVAHTK